MRSYKGSSVFFQRMKKKPRLQAILDRLAEYTEEQLDSVDQPLWIRQELKQLKLRGGLTSEQIAQQLAAKIPEVDRDLSKTYEVGRWVGGSQFVGNFSIELSTGDLVLFQPVEGLAKIAGHTVKVRAQDMAVLQTNCVHMGTFTMNQYNEMHVAHLNSKY